MSDLFERAAIEKLRFKSGKAGQAGLLNSEDLFIIPLTSTVGKTNLRDIGEAVTKRLRESGEDTFMGSSPANTLDNLRLDILKRVRDIREAANAAKVDAKVAKQEKQEILELISEKKKEKRSNLSLEQLEALAKGL